MILFALIGLLLRVSNAQISPSQPQEPLDAGNNLQSTWQNQSPTNFHLQSASNLPSFLQPNADRQDALINRFNFFDMELLGEFSETTQNIFLSPASIKVTLAMILEGAKGQGAEEIREALRISNIKDKPIRDILRTLLENLNERSYETFMETANSIFVSHKETILPEYKSIINWDYKGKIQQLNFDNIPNAVNTINNWVSNVTRGAIQDLVGPQSISQETSVLIANALYFKGKWEHAFDSKNTKRKCFKTTKKGCVAVPMMRIADNFNYNYINKLSAHAVEIPYQGAFSMLILLPSEDTSIRGLLRDIQHFRYRDVLDQLKPTDLSLEMPKFSIEYSVDLIDFLIPLKVREVFGSKANLTGILKNGNVKISNLIHKTKVEVDEFGTTAAAATGAIVIPLMGSTAIVVDRPFAFFIFHKGSKNIVFEGIVIEPSAALTAVNRVQSSARFFQPPVSVYTRNNFQNSYAQPQEFVQTARRNK